MSPEQTKTQPSETSRRTVGRVVSNKMNKSVTVSVERLVKHPVLRQVHSPHHEDHGARRGETCREGDTVAIVECRPISKRKAWKVVEIIERAPVDTGTHA